MNEKLFSVFLTFLICLMGLEVMLIATKYMPILPEPFQILLGILVGVAEAIFTVFIYIIWEDGGDE